MHVSLYTIPAEFVCQADKFAHVISSAVNCVNFISRRVNHRQVNIFHEYIDVQYGNLKHLYGDGWLSEGKVLKRFYK